MTDYYRRELNGVFPFLPQPGLRIVYLSVTKKYTLQPDGLLGETTHRW